MSADFTGGIVDARHARIAGPGKATLQCAEIRGGIGHGPFSYTTPGLAIDGRFVDGSVTCDSVSVRSEEDTEAAVVMVVGLVVDSEGVQIGGGGGIGGGGISYHGGVACGRASGRGELKREDGTYAYEGDWCDGAPHGTGTERLPTETYVGGFADGVRHGEGRITRKDGGGVELYCEHDTGELLIRCTMSERELALTRRLLHDALEAKDATEEACRREMDVLRAECERQTAAHRELLQCKVCFAKPSTTAIVPCGHVCLCEGCAEEIGSRGSGPASASPLRTRGQCPICRRTFTRVMTVFLQ